MANDSLEGKIFDVESEDEEKLVDPFNPEDISIDKKTVLVETCVKRLLQKTIVLSPDFQRHEVWDHVRKSRLIESLMLKIPIPMFYVSADEKNVYTVVDGLQRLSSLRDFVIGKNYLNSGEESEKGKGMKLQGIEFWTQYDGRTFAELPTYLQNRITETELTFTVINPGTPEEVKRNIFKRINTGGLYLTPQEIRNALYTGQSTILLDKLSTTDEFLNATCKAVRSERMEDIELILRCLAFMVREETYYPKNNSMDTFLSDTMLIINSYPQYDNSDMHKLYKRGSVIKESIIKRSPEELSILFTKGMSRSQELFGGHCFRRSHGDRRRSPINKALFEMWGSLLAVLTDKEFENIIFKKDQFLGEYYNKLDDVVFQNLISRDSWKASSLTTRFNKIRELINTHKQ